MGSPRPYTVSLTESALADLEEIKALITKLYSVSIASQSIDTIFERMMDLEQLPYNSKRDPTARGDLEVRYVNKGKSRIQFMISGSQVIILRVADTRQHPTRF